MMYFSKMLFILDKGHSYNSIFKYAKYFAKRHPRVVQDAKVIEVVLNFVEQPDRRDGN